MTREFKIEHYLEKEIRKLNGRALKVICLGLNGFPDRLILLPHAYVVFGECKKKTKTLDVLQNWFKGRILEPLGFKVYTIHQKKDVENLINDYHKWCKKCF